MSLRIYPPLLLSVLIISCTSPDQQETPGGQFIDVGPEHHVTFSPGEISWRDAPPSLEEGIQVAVLEGDPSEHTVFTMRIRFQDGHFISPHWHPNVERVTVISGTFYLGDGEEMDKANAMRLEPGSYTSMPPEMRHFAIAEGETVVQLTSVGPWEIHYVNPEDDPRLRGRPEAAAIDGN